MVDNTFKFSQRSDRMPEPVVHMAKHEIEILRAKGKDVVDFTQAQVSERPPEIIEQFLSGITPLSPSLYLFGPVPGLPVLREKLCEYRAGVFQDKILYDNVLVTAGANQALAVALAAITDPGDHVMLLSPYFFNHKMSIIAAGCQPYSIALDESSGFTLDADRILRGWAPSTRAVILTNPNNPTGAYSDSLSIYRLLEVAAKKGAWLIVDESYFHFLYSSHTDLPTFPLERTILLGSFSKSLSLAAWRIGYLISESALVKRAIKIQDALLIHPPAISQRAALVGLDALPDHMAHILPILDERRKLLHSLLHEHPAFSKVFGASAIFVFAKLAAAEESTVVARRLLHEFGIGVLPGSAFGSEGERFLRFCYGTTDLAAIETSFSRLREFR